MKKDFVLHRGDFRLTLYQNYPNAMSAYKNGVTVYMVQMADRQMAAIFFDKHKGCYIVQYEGQPSRPLLNEKGRPVKTFDELSDTLRGRKVVKKAQSHEEDFEIR